MIRFLIRLLGFLILAAGFVALVIDGARAIASGVVAFTPLGASWGSAAPESLAQTKAAAGTGAWAWIGDLVLAPVLAAPTFVVFAVLGVLLMALGRRRRKLVGVAP